MEERETARESNCVVMDESPMACATLHNLNLKTCISK